MALRCQLCGRDFEGPAYGYPVGARRKGCYCDPLCALRWLHDSGEPRKLVTYATIKQEGAAYLLPPPRLLTWFGGPLPYSKWKRKQPYWEAPAAPQPASVCVLSDADFSTIKKPRRKLGRPLFDTASPPPRSKRARGGGPRRARNGQA